MKMMTCIHTHKAEITLDKFLKSSLGKLHHLHKTKFHLFKFPCNIFLITPVMFSNSQDEDIKYFLNEVPFEVRYMSIKVSVNSFVSFFPLKQGTTLFQDFKEKDMYP